MVARPPSPSRPAALRAKREPAEARAQLRRRGRLSRALSGCAGKAMLAVGASVAGRQLPVWNVDVPASARLRQVLTGWAVAILRLREEGIPSAAHVTGKLGSPSLDLDATVLALKPQLPVKRGRLCITVSWPEIEVREVAGKKAAVPRTSVKASLSKLRISSRYTNVDRGAMGYHVSSTFAQKVQSGFYGQAGSQGVQLPRGQGEAMKACESSGLCGDGTVWPGTVQSLELVVYGRDAAAAGRELFRARLVGPEAQLANWAATARRFEKQNAAGPPDAELRARPFPVFIPSRGRAARAHLNWEAPHVFGPPGARAPGAWPVLCFVVEPQEEEEYRTAWPRALMLVLPKGGQGPSYSRWVVQQVCSRAYEWKAGIRRGGTNGICGPLRQLPWCWICDDNLLCFFRLVGIAKAATGRSSGPSVHKRREWETDAPLFWEAMVAVQQHPSLQSAAVAGFLRDDGTATCKKREWALDELSLYKVVLLNNRELRRLGAEYLPGLRMFEDIYLNTEVRRLGGHTLKCQSYCFRASHFSQGGCAEQRERGRRGSEEARGLGDLTDPRAFDSLSAEQQSAVRELLQWIQLREQQSLAKQQRQQQQQGQCCPSEAVTRAPSSGPRSVESCSCSGSDTDDASSTSSSCSSGRIEGT